jgi:hypothetical protein
MTTAQVNAVVRLTHDVPTLWLNRGDVGTVQSIWQSPVYRYEIEFSKLGQASVRALLGADLFELVHPGQVNAGREKEQAR